MQAATNEAVGVGGFMDDWRSCRSINAELHQRPRRTIHRADHEARLKAALVEVLEVVPCTGTIGMTVLEFSHILSQRTLGDAVALQKGGCTELEPSTAAPSPQI